MHITDLANELLLHIFQSSTDIPSLLALSSTCHHFHSILTSHRLPTLYQAAEAQYGPLSDATRVVTHNESQLAHLPRPAPPQSLALLKRLIEVGRVANQWAAVYPNQKWRGQDSASRRLLNMEERHRLRSACYRIWLYTLAFYTPSHTRTTRLHPQVIRTRALLLRPWPSQHLAEMLDLHAIFRQVLHSQICPSNGTVLRRHKQRFPDDHVPFVVTTGFAKARDECAGFQQGYFHSTPHMSRLSMAKNYNHHHGAVEGWGDEIAQYYVVEDMLKLHPGQLMHLFESVVGQVSSSDGLLGGWDPVGGSKGAVGHFVAGLGDWFENNGETLMETVGVVVADRGGDMGALREGVEDGWEGIARRDDGEGF
ncbi:hypothetical protein OEA41_009359 [Lepraria neglecta]|uniref:F-box domain-containing protein n=1 Tax=Lepraria neglecta TaxID=209136 RepID=A0AAE0DHP5_9LECA|nr:hypothetical protein OEA41_009359 [Lepraria neglecta]